MRDITVVGNHDADIDMKTQGFTSPKNASETRVKKSDILRYCKIMLSNGKPQHGPTKLKLSFCS